MAEYVPKESPDDKINISLLSPIVLLFQIFMFLFVLVGACCLFLLLLPGVAAKLTPMDLENRLIKEFSWGVKTHSKVETQPLFEKLKSNLSEELQKADVSAIKKNTENAYALLGNQILITQGFLDNAVYESEKLFVLAHELGHLHHRHPLQSIYRTFLGEIVLGLLGRKSSVSGLTSQITSLNFNRDQEKEADLYALNLLHKSTGDLKGAFHFFKRMKKKHGYWEGLYGSLFSTHPLSNERLKYLKKAAKKYSVK